MGKIRVAIEGGAGYTAGELIRILLNHPMAQISYVNSESHLGHSIAEVHTDLLGETDLQFKPIDFTDIDVLFLCKGHGKSFQFLGQNPIPEGVKVIDLSEDFRDERDNFVYGLPELNRERIKTTSRLANPGCFATAIELALLPLAANGMLYDDVHITAITGSTGAGQALSETSHFSWRNNNVSVYKPFTHQHLKEINRTIMRLQPDYRKSINMVPVRGNFSRGILASIYTQCHLDGEYVEQAVKRYYEHHPFTCLTDRMPDLKQVVNTSRCILYVERIDNKLLIVSILDNLLKGASGQAVQNMNLMFGLEETTGLKLKAIGF